MGFSLYDEEDEENQRRMAERFMGPQAVGGDYQLSAPDASLDPRMVDSFLRGRSAEADQSPAYPIPVREEPGAERGLFPALAGAALGAVDLAANKGRNIGQILGHVGNTAQQLVDDDRKRSDANFQSDRRAYLDQEDAGERKKQLELGGRNADLRQLELERQRAYDADVRTRFYAGQDSEETKAAKLAHEQAQTRVALAQAAGLTPGEDGLTSEQRERGKDRDADRTSREGIASATRDATAAQREAIAEGKRLEAARGAEKDRERSANTFRSKTEKTRPQLSRMDEIDKLISKPEYAQDLPGIGPLDSRWPEMLNSPDANALKLAVGDMSDMLVRQREGAVAPPAMYSVISKFVNAGPNATDQMFRDAYTAYQKILTEEIRQQGAGREDVAREVLGGQGDRVFGKQAPPPPAAAPPPPGASYQGGNGKRQAAGYDPMSSGAVNAPPPPMGQRFDGRQVPIDDLSGLQNQTLPVTGAPPPIPVQPPAAGGGGFDPEKRKRLEARGIIFSGGG